MRGPSSSASPDDAHHQKDVKPWGSHPALHKQHLASLLCAIDMWHNSGKWIGLHSRTVSIRAKRKLC